MVDMSVKIGSVTLQNPIMPASGCFSTDLAQVIDLNRLGALVAKTVSREFRAGNPPPRVSEVEGGMINSIGLPTKGIEYFLSHQVPDYKRFSPPLVGSISATTIEDFEAMARDVSTSAIDVLEVNISCPTRDPKGGNFALHEEHTFNVMRRIRQTTDKPIWCKLSPNAGDVVAIAKSAELAGADALVVSNTILGLKIDINTFRPAIGNTWRWSVLASPFENGTGARARVRSRSSALGSKTSLAVTWSCRFEPTPWSGATTSIPTASSSASGPTPLRRRIAGEPHAHYFNRITQYTIRPARGADGHDPYRPGLHHLCFRVAARADVDAIVAALRDVGVEVTVPALYPEYAPDYYATFFTDPDGIRLEVVAHRIMRSLVRDHWDELAEFEDPLRKAGLL